MSPFIYLAVIVFKSPFCSARNEAQPVAQPQLEDELDDLDVLDSDMEDDGDATRQPAEFGDFDDFDE